MLKKYKFILFSGLLLLCCMSLFCYKYFYAAKGQAGKEYPKISVIIPVYNVENYLDECLESVENQTLKELEIICVNDGSTDGSERILQEHKSKDDRIKIINQENKGVSEARNAGIEACTGKYIAFLDSDDVLLPYTYKVSYDNIEKYNADVLEYEVYHFNDGDKIKKEELVYNDSKVSFSTRKEAENPYNSLNLHACVIWDKLWKTSLIKDNNLRFNANVRFAEDTLFDWLVYPLIFKAVKDDNKLYCYRVNRNGSLMNITKSKKTLENYMLIIDDLINNFPQRFKFKDADKTILNIMLFLTQGKISTVFSELEDEEKINFAKQFVNKIENFIKQYGIIIEEEQEKQLNELKNLADEKI